MANKEKIYWIGPGSFMGSSFGEEIKGEIDKKDLEKLKKRKHISSTSLKPDVVAADSAAVKKVKDLQEKLSDQKKALDAVTDEKAALVKGMEDMEKVSFETLTELKAEYTKEIEELKKVNDELKGMLK